MYEPKIIAFLCTWCSYTGADSAGIARFKSPANIRAIRVPCSGRVSPEVIMRTFDQGADRVLVLGCHIGECHYDTGNHQTAKRLPIVRALMAFAGLEPERLRLDWVSASEGERFARIANEFVDGFQPLKSPTRSGGSSPCQVKTALLPEMYGVRVTAPILSPGWHVQAGWAAGSRRRTRRWRWLTFEWLLVVWSVFLLPFTFSRAGLLNLVILIMVSFLLFRPRLYHDREKQSKDCPGKKWMPSPMQRRWIEAVVVLVAVVLPIYLVGTRNMFFARLWQYWRKPDANLQEYMSYLGFDARLVYAQAAYNTYLAFPVLGVGLGNYAFYFEEMLPYRPIV